MTEIREIHEILFPSDLSPESDRALEHARFLAERFRARLTLYHAVELPRREYARWAHGLEQQVWERVESQARSELTRRAEGLTVPCHIVVDRDVSGVPLLVDVALLELVQRTGPDLIVMATHARKGFSGVFLGSVTQEVVRHAGRPVLCVRRAEHGVVFPYRTLILPTDLSEASRRAFPLAGLLARACEARVVALHVARAPTVAALSGVPGSAVASPPSADDVRRFLKPELDGLAVDVRVCEPGPTWDRIGQIAAREKADLVVMATRGHDSVSDRILGSNTERVLRHAPCPVLVV